MSPKYLTIIFVLFMGWPLLAQTWEISGIVRSGSGEPVGGASVYIDDYTGVISAENGFYRIVAAERPTQLIVQHLTHFSRRIVLTEADFVSQHAQTDVELTPQFLALPAVDIVSQKVQVLVEEDFSTDLYDYEFAGQNLLLLLRDRKRHLLRLVDESGQVLSELALAGAPYQLHRSCTGGLHIVGPDFTQELILNGFQLDTFPRYDTRKFRSVIEPCILKNDRYYIYRHSTLLNQAITYTYFDTYGGQHPLTEVRNRAAIREAYRNYHYFIHDAPFLVRAQNTPFSESINKGFDLDEFPDPSQAPLEIKALLPLAMSANQTAWLGALKSIEQDSNYAPLFKIGDQILVFDHVNGEIRRFDDLFRPEDMIPIGYHLEKGWKKELLKDDITQDVYAHFAPDGQHRLEKIDISGGGAARSYPLEQVRYLSYNFKMRDGYLYYIGQDDVNIPNRKLYKVDIAQQGKP
jgi:hypothetical protein